MSTDMRNLGGQKAYLEIGDVGIFMFVVDYWLMFNTEEDF